MFSWHADRKAFCSASHVAAVFLVLFLVTFLFDTRIGLACLVLAIVMCYRSGVGTRLKQIRTDPPAPSQKAWKDPWGTGPS